MPREVPLPKIDGFKIKAKMVGKPGKIAEVLRQASFLKVAKEKEGVSIAYVESRDITKKPYIFSVIKFRKDEIEVLFTIPPGTAPTRRKLNVIRSFLNILSMLGTLYDIENDLIYQLIEQTIKEMDEYATGDYKRLYNAYDSLRKEVEDLRRTTLMLRRQVKGLSKENYELKNESDELKLKLEALQGMSEGTLKTKIQEWIADHNGAINLSDFARVFKVPEARVEQVLDELVKEGYLEFIQ
jgi:regulator of replication initiation timing